MASSDAPTRSNLVYGDDDELPHEPEPSRAWQESYVVTWYDEAAGIGGFHRLGQEPAAASASALCGVFTREGRRFRRNDETVPLRDIDRGPEVFAAGEHRIRFGDGIRLEVREGPCEVDLGFEDFFPRYRYWNLVRGDSAIGDVGAGHYQIAGRVKGTARLDGARYEIDALGFRDHSWGDRHWDNVHAHRAFIGTIGPDLSWSLLTVVLPQAGLLRMGMVARDGEVAPVDDVEVVVHLEADGLTHRGGFGSARLPGGERLHVDQSVVDGVVLLIRGMVVVEGVGVGRVGERSGFCDFEVSNRGWGGTRAPEHALRASLAEGLTSR